MRFAALLGSSCIAALALVASPSAAQTTVSSDSNTALSTSTAGNVTIARGAELNVATGAAITVDSNNSVTIEDDDEDDEDDEQGQVTAGKDSGAIGMLVRPGVSTTVTNDGTISVLEDFEPADEDANGVADGTIAEGSGRYGIYVSPGGTVTGTIESTGVIKVEGINSAGIAVDSRLDGSLLAKGYTIVAGDDSVGVRTTDVTGDIVMEGTTLVTGRNARALLVEGDVGGVIRIQGTISHQTSYTYDDDGNSISLSRFDMRLGAPAVAVEGSVAGGIIIARPPADEDDDDDDEDNDGVDDSDEGIGAIAAYGDGPALLIGSERNISIGALSGSDGGYSLLVEGTVSGTALYSRTDAYGVVIGGLGGTVDLPGGIGVTGSIVATTQDSTATALLINEGANVGSITNSGTISAKISSQGEGASYGIRDLSGTLTRIENTGFITASGSSTDTVYAIDLSAATGDVTIDQFMNEDDLETRAEIEEDLDEGESDTTVYTSITGNIRFGSGNDTLSANAGQITGNSSFGAGNDQFLLSGEAVYKGNVYFGEGSGTAALSGDSEFVGSIDFDDTAGELSIADNALFSGTLSNAQNASVIVNGGSFGSDKARTTTLGRLEVRAGGTLDVYIDGDTGTSSRVVADTAVFEPGSRISATISSLEGAEGRYTILSAGNLQGTATFDEATTELPYIFAGTLSVENEELALEIRRKTASEAGVTRAAASGYDAILTAALSEDVIAQSFLDITNQEDLQEQLTQMLPDHAGGLFDAVTRSTRLVSGHIMQGSSLFDTVDVGDASLWFEPVYWRSNRNATGTSGYKSSAWSFSAGVEWLTDIGQVGGSYAWINGTVDSNGGTQEMGISQHDIAAFWRVPSGYPLFAYARIGAALASFSSERTVSGVAAGSDFSASTSGKWSGWLISGMGGASYDFKLAEQFTIQPKLGLEWFRLAEGGYTESGGGEAIDLEVAARKSHSLNARTTIAIAYSFGAAQDRLKPLTLELEAGRRTVLAGSLGVTTASFEDGDLFSITPDKLDDSWLGELRLTAGGWGYKWRISAGAEQADNSEPAYSARISVSAHF